jgi:hypothetical protein
METQTRPVGASADEWQHFSKHLGLTADLLPVVSNALATISPKSSMRDIGKTPSRYSPQREVVGIPQWTLAHSSDHQVALWQREPDYGIALQTRLVRAVDIDIGDPLKSRAVADLMELVAGFLPTRGRANSGKLLLAFTMQGQFNKRVLHTPDGIIEFLANGQQFIAMGTHPSGSRYEWIGGLPAEIPELSPAEFEALWAGLKDAFAIDSAEFTTGARPSVARRADHIHDDPVVGFLAENAWLKEYDRDGRVHVRCPWEDQHTSDSGPTATSYFPRGVGGFTTGGFKCLHAHCGAQNIGHFLKAIGYEREMFEDVSYQKSSNDMFGDEGESQELSVAAGLGEFESEEPWPTLVRDKKGILCTADNMLKAVGRPDMVKMRTAYDQFKDAVLVSHQDEPMWRPIKDTDYIRVQTELERRGFVSVAQEMLKASIMRVAEINTFDSAIQWIKGLEWDGVPRVDSFLTTYFGAKDSEYARAVARYMWSAMAGRALAPGVKADMVPVFIGKQGTGKTSALQALVPDQTAYLELDLGTRDENLARSLRGKLIAELAELKGLRGRDAESIKAWLTRQHEEWIPKYREFATTFARRFLPIGTGNEREILDDTTGERRWLPVDVALEQDLAAIRRDRDQLWAEGAIIFEMEGIAWQDAQRLAVAEHGKFKITDDWDEVVELWLLRDGMDEMTGTSRGSGHVKTRDILVSALGFDLKAITRKEEMRVSKILARLGFIKVDGRVDGQKAKFWKAGAACTLNFAR